MNCLVVYWFIRDVWPLPLKDARVVYVDHDEVLAEDGWYVSFGLEFLRDNH